MHARRWGDNDHHLGPFIFARDKRFKHFALVLSSGDDEYPSCRLRFSCYGITVIVALPHVIKPYMEKVYPVSWDAATIERLGRDWYWQVDEREYGFSLVDGHLSFALGRQTHDSDTTRSKGYFLPWTQWRFVRHSLYDTAGAHFWTEPKRKPGKPYDFETGWKAKEECPKVAFAFKDFDGEELVATTNIEEREWKFGEGQFKWLSLFRRKKIRRSLDIQFSGETGQRKGSWKGGTVGSGIDMLPGELHEAAFKRYCQQHDMTFVGSAA
ncbi:hypothetical protein DXM27_05180 [Rhizobium rhizogenes]|uniref:Uncharacterized protein n=1 Tax=Rhizobium rhizogenes TaxID=359 RepID=A0AA88JSL7_RHIRH|nr:hypothetical protein [Rhizobium rhizogenes]KAA3504607.1 hypothetical protein DXM27_05180 [Rhizobium rhizogenes]